MLILLVLPTILTALDQAFYIAFATRMLVFMLAATSLNLVLGFGGMVSLGMLPLRLYGQALCLQAGISEGLLVFSGHGRRRIICAAGWQHQSAYPGRSLHHDHPGFCPDGVLISALAAVLGGDDGLSLGGRMSIAGFRFRQAMLPCSMSHLQPWRW